MKTKIMGIPLAAVRNELLTADGKPRPGLTGKKLEAARDFAQGEHDRRAVDSWHRERNTRKSQ